MRYFHRTALTPDDAIASADTFFGTRLQTAESGHRSRTYAGSLGRIEVEVEAEGGHYTLITLRTDQVGESELDKLGKRFLSEVHTRVAPGHVARGAY
jgi:hypothetical protein